MPRTRLIVLKFGGSVLRSERDLPRVVTEIDRWRRDGFAVVAVVSAFHGQTDRLLADGLRRSERPDPGALAALVATGEQAAAASLALALDRAGIGVRTLDGASAGLRTSGDPLDATLISIRTDAFREAWAADEVAVVPGFVGRDASGRTTLLGRGGSDYTALFIASSLRARCRLVKDVAGLFDRDPAEPGARLLASVSWEDARRIGGRVLQPKALRFAESAGFLFEVGGLDDPSGAIVGAELTFAAPEQEAERRVVRVAVLGAGTVGLGALEHLLSRPEQFEVVGVAVRDPSAAVARGAPSALVTTDAAALIRSDCDVVFEAIGGVDPAAGLIEAALTSGRHVVTVNKSALAQRAGRLERAAADGGVCLKRSGAVGGAVPLLATAARLRDERSVVAFEGVLNGTTNFVLDRLGDGVSLADAIAQAQSRSFAEADPLRDLGGTDAAEKLALLAAEALGVAVAPEQVETRGVLDVTTSRCVDAARSGQRVRLVASFNRGEDGLRLRVAPREVRSDGWLGGARDEWNAGSFRCGDGSVVRVRGRGAGRWSTAQAALADLLEVRRRVLSTADSLAEAVAS